MATQQEYLDDLERKLMVEVKINDLGKKIYAVRGPIALPAYDAMPFDPTRATPEQWRAAVLANFQDVYLEWWTNAFSALAAQLAGQTFSERSLLTNAGVEYNPDTSLFEERGVPPGTAEP